MRRKSNSGRLVMTGSEGSIAVMVAIAMVVLLGAASLAIDVGQLFTVRNELQNTADSAAIAAARALIVEDTANRDVYRDATGAYNKAISMIQAGATNQGLTWDPNGYQISVTFAYYNDHALTSKWNLIGVTGDKSEVASNSNANAVQVTVKRAADKSTYKYGPVTNFFAGVLGLGTTEVAASAKAYMGYTAMTYKGTVQLPLALPATGGDSPLASKGNSGWWDRMFGPDEAVASAPVPRPLFSGIQAATIIPLVPAPVRQMYLPMCLQAVALTTSIRIKSISLPSVRAIPCPAPSRTS